MILGVGKSTVLVPKTVYNEIIEHAKEAYPHECCGFLIGKDMRDKKVWSVERGTNLNTERANDRYVIDPQEFNFVDKIARTQGLDILGFYHSHPDHPDTPSEFDRENGQPGYSYIIVSVQNGTEFSMKSWIFNKMDEPFKKERLKVVD